MIDEMLWANHYFVFCTKQFVSSTKSHVVWIADANFRCHVMIIIIMLW